MSNAPHAGLRVLELARILAGPWAGQMFADMGADVIKVESPTGDDTRKWGPPFVENDDGSAGDAAYFYSCNRGKRSVAVDFSQESGREILRRLAARSDVMIENFKTGGLKKYGLDYDSLKAINPRLIYCSITGFGQTGPYATRPGYDFIIQAMGGIMDLTGEPDGEPQKAGVAFADIFTGTYSVIAIQAALAVRENTGMGQYIDMSLLDTQAGVLANQAMNYLVSGTVPKRMGNGHLNLVPYQAFQVADGHLVIAVGNDRQFRKFCDMIGAPDLPDDPAYATNADRIRNRDALIALISEGVAGFTRADLQAKLDELGIPAGPINPVDDVFADPQIIHRGMQVDLPAPGLRGGTLPNVRSPLKFSESELSLKHAAPKLGEHTDEVLAELGLGAAAE